MADIQAQIKQAKAELQRAAESLAIWESFESVITSCLDQPLASSSEMSLALSKRCSRSRNTTRHLLMVEAARRVTFTHASKSCHGLVLTEDQLL